ncbi:MAG: hypothetical protein VX408_05940, partial [Pseudomonadota bacterium]|nr:hypothetical protein [Pseudomonadota bacterium]
LILIIDIDKAIAFFVMPMFNLAALHGGTAPYCLDVRNIDSYDYHKKTPAQWPTFSNVRFNHEYRFSYARTSP